MQGSGNPKTLFVSVVVVLLTLSAFSQNSKESFSIPLTAHKVSGSLYNEIRFIDARSDTANLGFVQHGIFNTGIEIKIKKSFSIQLRDLIREMTDTTAQKHDLFFQLRKFYFSEQNGPYVENCSFRFQAALYAKLDNWFIKIGDINTALQGKGDNAFKFMLYIAGNQIDSFVEQNLKNDITNLDFISQAEIENPDSVEKRHIKLYTTKQYADGLYLSYKSFAEQMPDMTMIVEEKNNKIRNVRITDSTGRTVKIKSKEVYAMVYKGQPYAATSYDFYPLSKEVDDFYFTGKVKALVVPTVRHAFGLMGSFISSKNYYTFEMKIDHQSGDFICVRYLPDPI